MNRNGQIDYQYGFTAYRTESRDLMMCLNKLDVPNLKCSAGGVHVIFLIKTMTSLKNFQTY